VTRPPAAGSLLRDLPAAFDGEVFDTLLRGGKFRLQRIVSNGQAMPPGQWLDQDDDEWVVVVAGSAVLSVEGMEHTHALTPGDWLLLPAHCRHRVEWTDPDRPTVWLALHWVA